MVIFEELEIRTLQSLLKEYMTITEIKWSKIKFSVKHC